MAQQRQSRCSIPHTPLKGGSDVRTITATILAFAMFLATATMEAPIARLSDHGEGGAVAEHGDGGAVAEHADGGGPVG